MVVGKKKKKTVVFTLDAQTTLTYWQNTVGRSFHHCKVH